MLMEPSYYHRVGLELVRFAADYEPIFILP